MRDRTDRNGNRNENAGNRRQDQDENKKDKSSSESKNKRTGENRENRKEKDRILPVSFIKTGKDIIKSVLFWCVAVSVAASACHIVSDAVSSFGDRRLTAESQTAAGHPAEGTGLPAESRAAAGQTTEMAESQVAAGQATEMAESRAAAGQIAELPAVNQDAASGEQYQTGENAPGGSFPENQSAEPEKKTVALTFDDGPHPVYTKKLLDGLLERGVKATFFVIGENIPGNEDLIARMEEEGHLIGNHTYNHVKICDMEKEDACYQVEQTSALVREITGHDTEYVRPPFGAWNPELECSFVMIPVLWDVDPLDWTTSNTSLVVQRVVEDADDQDIILLHDFYESSVDAALQIVDILKKEGFEFVTVDKLILP